MELGPVGRVGSDHSRVCGEDRRGYRRVTFFCGPPPRMRGRLPRVWGRCGSMGTTPRVCGEDWVAGVGATNGHGPPPRMRGRPRAGVFDACPPGTTPAYAGKTHGAGGKHGWCWDHPRVCGEDKPNTLSSVPLTGPPPRMRGRRRVLPDQLVTEGTTPAYAGKTAVFTVRRWRQGDHPRVCGEDSELELLSNQLPGPPPRMRGRLLEHMSMSLRDRTTPAYAGKTSSNLTTFRSRTDHPRVCGEDGA